MPSIPLAALRSPPVFLACGAGSGLSPIAPGTCGTAAALLIYLLWLDGLSPAAYSLALLAAIAAGPWLCARAGGALGKTDHPAIVWDEFAGYWTAMWLAPEGWLWALAGFALFRFFDIAKPWPISWLERSLPGGWGVMADDLAAGAAAGLCLHGAAALLAWGW